MTDTRTHARAFLAAVEAAHPFRPMTETTIQTIRKRTAWLLNERETGISREVDKMQPEWLSALDKLLDHYTVLLPVEQVRVLHRFDTARNCKAPV